MTPRVNRTDQLTSRILGIGVGSKVHCPLRPVNQLRELYQKVTSYAKLTTDSEKLHNLATCSPEELKLALPFTMQPFEHDSSQEIGPSLSCSKRFIIVYNCSYFHNNFHLFCVKNKSKS